MAYTFALAEGRSIGESLNEPEFIQTAQSALAKAKQKGVKFLLPLDNLGVKDLDFGAGTVGESKFFERNIEDGWEGVDPIGPRASSFLATKSKMLRPFSGMGPWVFSK